MAASNNNNAAKPLGLDPSAFLPQSKYQGKPFFLVFSIFFNFQLFFNLFVIASLFSF
jgi:hypothetical protein